jgi:hypothetical protein
VVMTTAGYVMGPDLDMARVIDFRLSVDRVRPRVTAAAGNVAMQRFTPRTYGENMTDRTSFTRFRALRTNGQWGGQDPIAVA